MNDKTTQPREQASERASLPLIGHPEPRVMAWTALEENAIRAAQYEAFDAGYRAALSARQAAPEAPTNDAVRIAKKQMADSKLAGPGATAHERYLHIELEVLQRAVMRCAGAYAPTATTASASEPHNWSDAVPCEKCGMVGWHICRAAMSAATEQGEKP